jgi:hypothetical protein
MAIRTTFPLAKGQHIRPTGRIFTRAMPFARRDQVLDCSRLTVAAAHEPRDA